MSFLYPLPSTAPKKWVKQEKKRIELEISECLSLIKQHTALRKKVGLSQPEYTKDTKNNNKSSIDKNELTETWGVKLSYSASIPKKRGRPRKADIDTTQTKSILFRNNSNADTEKN